MGVNIITQTQKVRFNTDQHRKYITDDICYGRPWSPARTMRKLSTTLPQELYAFYRCKSHQNRDTDLVYVQVNSTMYSIPTPYACIGADQADAVSTCEWEFCGYAHYTFYNEWNLDSTLLYFYDQDIRHYSPLGESLDPCKDFLRVEIKENMIKCASKRG